MTTEKTDYKSSFEHRLLYQKVQVCTFSCIFYKAVMLWMYFDIDQCVNVMRHKYKLENSLGKQLLWLYTAKNKKVNIS